MIYKTLTGSALSVELKGMGITLKAVVQPKLEGEDADAESLSLK